MFFSVSNLLGTGSYDCKFELKFASAVIFFSRKKSIKSQIAKTKNKIYENIKINSKVVLFSKTSSIAFSSNISNLIKKNAKPPRLNIANKSCKAPLKYFFK